MAELKLQTLFENSCFSYVFFKEAIAKKAEKFFFSYAANEGLKSFIKKNIDLFLMR